MSKLGQFKKVFIFISLIFCFESIAYAMTVLPLGLKDLTDQSGRIFVGRCLEVRLGDDEHGLSATYVRFQVMDGLKGVNTGDTVEFKMFGTRKKNLHVAEGEKIIWPVKSVSATGGVYEEGVEYLLFLYPDSTLGFTSPVGGGQGQFEVEPTAQGGLILDPLSTAPGLKAMKVKPAQNVSLQNFLKQLKPLIKKTSKGAL